VLSAASIFAVIVVSVSVDVVGTYTVLYILCRLYYHKTAEPSTGFFATITNMVSI